MSTAVYLDAMTIAEHRAEAIYTDSIGTDFTTTTNKTILKDGLTGAGITYAASASAYRWTQIERANRKLVRRLTLQLGSGSANFDVSTSEDGITWRWFAGVSGVNGYSLTERVDELTAQANTSLFSALTYGFAELPGEIDCRYVTVYHRHTSASYRLDECYPRSRLTVDDLDAEIIRGMTILGDQLVVNQLSALTADLGSITAGTVTGATIQTATSGARVVLSSAAAGGIIGYNGSDTYSVTAGTGTYQVLWSKADGKFYIATGKIVFSADGIRFAADNTSLTDLRWETSGVSSLSVNGSYNSGASYGYVVNGVGWGAASKYGQLLLRATGRSASGGPLGPTGVDIQHAIYIGAGTDPAATFSNGWFFTTYWPGIDSGHVKVAQISSGGNLSAIGDATISGGINVGSATGAGTGEIRASSTLHAGYGVSTGTATVEIGSGRSGSGYSNLDLVGDTTYTDYGTRLIRNNTGANAVSSLEHRGTGALRLNAIDAGTVDIYTSNAQRLQVLSGGGLVVVGGLASNWAGSKETSTSNLKMGVFSGEPGVAYGNGILGYNYLPLTGGSSGREDTGTGAGYLRFKEEGSMQIVMVGSDGTSRQIADYGGQYVGIGVARVTNQRFTINGTGTTSSTYGLVVRDSGNTNNMWVRDDGAGFLRAAAWTYGSDRKLKENIAALDSKLEALMALRPVTFDYIGAGQKNQIGFIAQEVQEVLPELVQVVDETGTLGLQTTNLIPMLVQAMQDLVTQYRADMTEVRTALAQQSAAITQIRAEMAALAA